MPRGMWPRAVSRKWIFLKDDRFLSGANWGLVRKYLPDPVAYPLTADELESMDTLAETRRRLLEKERSSYWAQFRAGLLSARAVAQLDNNLSEFLDQAGQDSDESA